MCGADGVRFRSASEPVRASLVSFHASLGSEIDNAITLLHAAPTRPAPIAVLAVTLRGSRHDIYLFGARTGGTSLAGSMIPDPATSSSYGLVDAAIGGEV